MKLKYLILTLIFSIFLLIPLCHAEEYPFNGIIFGDSLVVYSDAKGTNKITQLAYGTRVTVLEKNNKLYKITYAGGTGYSYASYILNVDDTVQYTTVSGFTDYNDYCTSLRAQGFPDSYCPYLYGLYVKHPNWVFKADIINSTLENLSNLETKYCVLQTGNANYHLNGSKIEGDYYYIKDSVISSFMDPRNSLSEKLIFQFLDHEDSKDIINDQTLTNLVASNSTLGSYCGIFKEAGITQGINALHLLTRSIQEGANGKDNQGRVYASVSGDYTTRFGKGTKDDYSLDGYYNFFNIGAWNGDGYTTVQRGLVYAAGFFSESKCITVREDGKSVYDPAKCGELSFNRPWDSPEKAIHGGAMFIKDQYTTKGQDTNYYEKFNVASYRTLDQCSHQYMTNIYAPAAESINMANAYKNSGLLDSAFVFVIPVYQNMRNTPYQAIDFSNNALLSAITIDNRLLNNYDPDISEYIHYAPTDNSKVVVSATSNFNAKIEGLGEYEFTNGEVKVTIKVTSEDNSTVKVYNITIKQVSPNNYVEVNDLINKMAVKINNDVMYGISPGTAVNTIVNSVTSLNGSAEIYNSNNERKYEGNLATGDKIVVRGTVEAKTFNVSIRGDLNGDGNINVADLVLVQSHILEKVKLENEKYLASDVNYDGKINVADLVIVQSHILEKGSL